MVGHPLELLERRLGTVHVIVWLGLPRAVEAEQVERALPVIGLVLLGDGEELPKEVQLAPGAPPPALALLGDPSPLVPGLPGVLLGTGPGASPPPWDSRRTGRTHPRRTPPPGFTAHWLDTSQEDEAEDCVGGPSANRAAFLALALDLAPRPCASRDVEEATVDTSSSESES